MLTWNNRCAEAHSEPPLTQTDELCCPLLEKEEFHAALTVDRTHSRCWVCDSLCVRSLTSDHQVEFSSARKALPCSTPPPSSSGSTACSSCSSTGRLLLSLGACRGTPSWSCPEGLELRVSPLLNTRQK